MNIPHTNSFDNEEWKDDLSTFINIVNDKPESFFHAASFQLNGDAKARLIDALEKSPSFGGTKTNDDLPMMSPSGWDCPINHTKLFERQKNPNSSTAVPSSPKLENSESPIKTVNIIIPSLTVDIEELKKLDGIVHYEERQLFNLLSLKDPSTHVIYITAVPLHPSVINYYLSFLEDNDAKKRLTFFSTFDSSMKPLTQKILDRPRLQAKIRRTVEKIGPYTANMICFIPTDLEHALAKALNASLEASPSDVQFWGSKCGSRQIFKHCEVPCPRGVYESIWDVDELVKQISILLKEIPDVKRIVVKLNEGFSGEGNAILEIDGISSKISNDSDDKERLSVILEELKHHLRYQAPTESWESFSGKIKILGCIIEEYIEGQNKQSPSVQGMIFDDGSTKIVSSHEQILGGNDDQVYVGCRFPCDSDYRRILHEYTKEIADFLAKKGARGRFGVDFICVPLDFDGEWDIYALEINLRQGGTTHPYETLHLLTDGDYSEADGIYTDYKGEEKYYFASDNLRKEEYCGLLPSDLMTIIGNHELLFDHDTHKGCVFHLMGALSQYGKLGITCISNSLEEAEELYHQVVEILDNEVSK